MKFSFNHKTAAQVLDLVKEGLGGKELSKILKFTLNDDTLTVTISKFGTSELVFAFSNQGDGVQFSLEHQKIAFAHKAFQGDVIEKLTDVIQKAGGKVKA